MLQFSRPFRCFSPRPEAEKGRRKRAPSGARFGAFPFCSALAFDPLSGWGGAVPAGAKKDLKMLPLKRFGD
jgi:hypothetical protein